MTVVLLLLMMMMMMMMMQVLCQRLCPEGMARTSTKRKRQVPKGLSLLPLLLQHYFQPHPLRLVWHEAGQAALQTDVA
jgi:hypothetical protein